MTLSKAIGLRILQLCDERNITINKLATLSGLSQSTVSEIVSGASKKAQVFTIARICYGLKIELSEFFVTSIFDINHIDF